MKVHLLEDCLVSVSVSYIRNNNCYGCTGYGRATEAKKGRQWSSLSDNKNYADKQRLIQVQQNPRSHSVFKENTSALGVQYESLEHVFHNATQLRRAKQMADNT